MEFQSVVEEKLCRPFGSLVVDNLQQQLEVGEQEEVD
jgi:hypothetical protein